MKKKSTCTRFESLKEPAKDGENEEGEKKQNPKQSGSNPFVRTSKRAGSSRWSALKSEEDGENMENTFKRKNGREERLPRYSRGPHFRKNRREIPKPIPIPTFDLSEATRKNDFPALGEVGKSGR